MGCGCVVDNKAQICVESVIHLCADTEIHPWICLSGIHQWAEWPAVFLMLFIWLDRFESWKNAGLLSSFLLLTLLTLLIVVPHLKTEGKFISPPPLTRKTSPPDSAGGFNSHSFRRPGQECVSTTAVPSGAFHISGVLQPLAQLPEATNTSSHCARSYITLTAQTHSRFSF